MDPILLALFSLHEDLLQILVSMFTRLPDFEVVIATRDGFSLIHGVEELKPQVALIDQFRLADLESFCRSLQHANAETRLALLSSGVAERFQPLPTVDHVALEKPVRGNELASQIRALVSGQLLPRSHRSHG